MVNTLQRFSMRILICYYCLSDWGCCIRFLIFISYDVFSFLTSLVDVVICIDHLHQRLKTHRISIIIRTLTISSLSTSIVSRSNHLLSFGRLVPFLESLDSISIAKGVESVLARERSRSNVGNHDCPAESCKRIFKHHS